MTNEEFKQKFEILVRSFVMLDDFVFALEMSEAINGIRALIQNRPMVDEKFIRDWYERLYFAAKEKSWGRMAEILKIMLKEAGVSVEEHIPTETINDADRIREEK